MSTSTASGGSIIPMLMCFVFMGLYFLPTIIALAKRNNRTKVILFNVFLAWTIVMWIISLVWACKREEEPEVVATAKPVIPATPVAPVVPVTPVTPAPVAPVAPAPVAPVAPVTEVTAADEIKKYKELLDAGAITAEEFEEKKKQLLSL